MRLLELPQGPLSRTPEETICRDIVALRRQEQLKRADGDIVIATGQFGPFALGPRVRNGRPLRKGKRQRKKSGNESVSSHKVLLLRVMTQCG